MRDFLVLQQADGTARGFNPEFVCRFESTPQGGALLHFIDGGQLALQPFEWKIAGPAFSEPQAAPQSAGSAGA